MPLDDHACRVRGPSAPACRATPRLTVCDAWLPRPRQDLQTRCGQASPRLFASRSFPIHALQLGFPLLRLDITPVGDDLLVIAEAYGEWEDSNRLIDLLCLSKDAGLVVIEIKRTEDCGYMELQAICFAAMVSIYAAPFKREFTTRHSRQQR